jgi:predicted Co/Zn/Cd cation transporter (cation efflux family)
MISSAVGLVFGVVFLLRASRWQHFVPYVDPVLVVVMVAATLGVPWRMVRQGIGELLIVAPDETLQQEVRKRIRGIIDDQGFEHAYLRTVKIGRWFSVVIHMVVPASFRLERVAELDAIRRRAAQALEGIQPNLVVDIIFCEDVRWALGPAIEPGQVDHLRIDPTGTTC